ncbi:MAG: hypothetical protein AB7T06_46880 [Kofleriaceae bacterium]
MASSLPKFSRGLKLSRLGIIVMLLQLALTIFMTIKSMAVSDLDGAMSVIEWTGYLMIASIVSTGVLLLGVITSVAELRRVGIDIKGILIALVGFAIATIALVWTYRVYSEFVDILTHIDADGSLERLEAATSDVESLKFVVIVKDIGYSIGLIMLLRMVQRIAAFNDQLSLRDDAGHMSRAIIVMMLGDLFYQATYGLGGGTGILGAVGGLLIGGYWIWCHIKLVRFFENAAHFVNEPHDLPLATVLKVPETKDLKPKPSPMPRQSRPSMPKIADASAPPLVIERPSAPAIVPRAPSAAPSEGEAPPGDGPKFLR